MGNAIKFTEQGEIIVRVESNRESAVRPSVHFSVADTGIGIPPEKQKLIFDAFTQSDSFDHAQLRRHRSGLSISSRLITLMGGTIWVKSPPGQGSTFHFKVPFGLQSRPPPGHRHCIPRKLPPAPTKYRQCFKILLAEDNRINQRVAQRLLEKRGHTVVLAESGWKPRLRGGIQSFDLILMDCADARNGRVRGHREDPRPRRSIGKHIPIIAMTAHALVGDRERCLAAGMDDYVSKPINSARYSLPSIEPPSPRN